MEQIELETLFSIKAVMRGKNIKLVGPEGGKLIVINPEEAIKLAHDLLGKAEKMLKKEGRVASP